MTKTATQIAQGFDRRNVQRALHLVDIAQREGAQMTAKVIEMMLDAPGVDDSEILQAIRYWVKEIRDEESADRILVLGAAGMIVEENT